MAFNEISRYLYYFLKPAIPRTIQVKSRREFVKRRRSLYGDIWPIDPRANTPPRGWSGWPHEKQFALILTHDVDTERGLGRCYELIRWEQDLDVRSCFNFVPERYDAPVQLRRYLVDNGFEVGVHGLCHDGKLYRSEALFRRRAQRINHYLKDWGAVGFRSPSMHHNLDWIQDLNIEYDSSTFDTDPFEPQPNGVGTIFPFWVKGDSLKRGYVELPYTLPQDFTLFVLMQEKTIDIWKRKLDWIAECGGMALLNTHPDYLNLSASKPRFDEFPASYYGEFLDYIRRKYEGKYWLALPKEVARFWARNYLDSARQ
jgi:hypothetical protein